jgi:disulfide bond formation protein DsbB
MQAIADDFKQADAATIAAAIFIAGLATIVGFLFFEHVVKLAPGPLCLEQRKAFYIGVPLAGLLWLGASHGASRKVMIAGFAVIAAFMLWNAGLGAYHAGIEWKFWPGPAECSGPVTSLGGAGGLLGQLQNVNVVRCDEAAWRFLGISLPGYNVLISLTLGAAAAWAALGAWRRA